VSATRLAKGTVDLIADEDALAGVSESWRGLAEARGNAFVTPEWFFAVRKSGDDGSTPVVAVVRDETGEVRGVLPLLAEGSGRSATVSFAGAGRADLVHPAATEEDEAAVARLAAGALARHLGSRCRLDLGRVDETSVWWQELAAGWPSRLSAVLGPPEPLPFASIEGLSWDGYLATRSGQFRNQVRRKTRSLERDHTVALRRASSAEEARAGVETLLRLHDSRWRHRRDDTALAEPGARELLREFAVPAHERGWLRLYSLEVDGQAVAAWYGWRLGDRFSYYQAGFDPSWSRQSVGFLMLARTVEAAIAEGASVYDLLLGGEAFKSRFATGEAQGRAVLLAPPLSAARLAAVAGARARTLVRALPEGPRERVRDLRRAVPGGG
jgi:CelD/BcsL family acetyltransferase involved in cellulose biosynthesis